MVTGTYVSISFCKDLLKFMDPSSGNDLHIITLTLIELMISLRSLCFTHI